jgi:hypothetical protein
MEKKQPQNNKQKKQQCSDKDSSSMTDIVDQIVEMYPEYKLNKETIIQKLSIKQESKKQINQELIFDKIILNNEVFYKDKNNYLWNSNAQIIGILESNAIYHLFSDKMENILQNNELTKISLK